MHGEQGQLRAWTMESRIRFALVWGGLNALVVIGLTAMFGSLSGSTLLWLALAGFVLSFLAQALIWYPLAKRKVMRQHSHTQ